jgi:hypothetical protein
MVKPWREDVSVGAANDKEKNELYICIIVDHKWEGVLKFDLPRHRTIWNLPFEYPRLNGTPEWYPVDPRKTYVVVDLNNDRKSIYSGESLAHGLPIVHKNKAFPLFLKVFKNSPD